MTGSPTILDHPIVSSRYFFPRREVNPDPFWIDCGEARLSCFYHREKPNNRTVVLFHGNGELASDYIQLFVPIFRQIGFNCLLAEYRGYGMSTGRPMLAGMLDDVPCIIEAAGQPPEKIILFGRSLGSLYAVHGAHLFPEISCLIIESGIADIMERLSQRVRPHELGITEKAMKEAADRHFDHQDKLKNFKGPTLILHANGDNLVPVHHAHNLYAWANRPKKLKIFEKGDHNDIFVVNAEAYITEIYTILSQTK